MLSNSVGLQIQVDNLQTAKRHTYSYFTDDFDA